MTAVRALAFLSCVVVPPVCLAQAQPSDDPEAAIARLCRPEGSFEVPAACGPTRLSTYEPIYGVYQWTEDDERALRLHYSFRYAMFVPDCLADHLPAAGAKESERRAAAQRALNCLNAYARRVELYVMYTGEFDFYMGTRPSGPVVNRISNPGAHLRKYVERGEGSFKLRWVDVGVEHRSNGQTTEAAALTHEGEFRAQVAYRFNDHAYLDSISRDTNYLIAETKYDVADGVEFWARVKPVYFGNKTDITWGPHALQDIHMADYDRFRFLLGYRLRGAHRRYADQARLFLEWTVGDKALATDSLNVGLYLPADLGGGFRVPLFLRAHFGPLHTLSDFTKKQNAFGIGLLLLQ